MTEPEDTLNADWIYKSMLEKEFAIRAIIEDFYNSLTQAIATGQDLYPTGRAVFDAYVQPIVSEMVTFKNQLEANYAEFIGWRQP